MGRILLEGFQRNSPASVSPVPVFGTPFGVILSSSATPDVRVLSIAGIAMPPNPRGNFMMPDIALNQTAPVAVEIEARNVPPGTVVKLYLISEIEPAKIVDSTPLAGTLGHSTATATTVIPSGFSQGFVRATWTP